MEKLTVQPRCPVCKGNLLLDDDDEVYHCILCGREFIRIYGKKSGKTMELIAQ